MRTLYFLRKIVGVVPEEKPSGGVEKRLEDDLRRAFERAGWRVTVGRHGHDVVIQRGRVRYALAVRVARDSRSAHLQALLADACLRARSAGRRLDVEPLAVVGAPMVTDRTARQLDEYARTFLEGTPYGLVDAEGRRELHGPGLEGIGASPDRPLETRRVRAPAVFDPFSDLNQWMLKVLLADRVPRNLLSAPRERIGNARQLALAAKASVPTASRFVSHMRRDGWLVDAGRRLELARVDELLGRWQAASAKPVHELRAKWLLPSKDLRAQLDRGLRRLREQAGGRRARACLALFSAAERLGYAHARGMSQHVYCDGDFEEVLDVLQAVPAGEHEGADLVLRRPAFRESVFRGAVDCEGVPTSDVLQTWLDVSSHPSRGSEQAEHLWRRVIMPNILRRSSP